MSSPSTPAAVPSVHSQVLEYLGGITVPDSCKDLVLDWAGSPLSKVKEARLATHDFCPCEFLANDPAHGMEVQHKDGLFGISSGNAGLAFSVALANQNPNMNNMQALIGPNLPPPVRTMMITKVETDNMNRIVQMWGSAQENIARAVTLAYEYGWFPASYARTHVLVVAVFIHPYAGLEAPGEGGKFNKKNFLKDGDLEKSMHAVGTLAQISTLGLISDALTGGLTSEERVARAKTTKHLFRGYAEKAAA